MFHIDITIAQKFFFTLGIVTDYIWLAVILVEVANIILFILRLVFYLSLYKMIQFYINSILYEPNRDLLFLILLSISYSTAADIEDK